MKSVKKLALFLVLAVAFTSCSKDDDNGSSASLIGTWKIVSETYNGERESLDTCELKSTVTFTETKITSRTFYGSSCENQEEYEERYTRDGNTLTIRDGSYSYSLEITKLTETTLEVTDRDEGDVFVQSFVRQ